MKVRSTLLIVPIVAVVLAGCTAKTTPEVDDSSMMQQAPATDTGTMNETPMDEQTKMPASDMIVDLAMSDYQFDKSEVRVKAGSTVTFRLSNSGGTHDFMIDELGVKSRVMETGEMQEINVTIPLDAAGQTYEYYCSVLNHRDMGMSGNLVIE
jgi:plastocyanin